MVKKFWACYEGEGDGTGDSTTGEGGTGDGTAGEGGTGDGSGTAGSGDGTVATQDQLNSVLAKEKKKFRTEREKMAKQLEQYRSTAQLSTKQRDELEKQIEDLRTANMTSEERQRHQLNQTQKEHDTKLGAATELASGWEIKFQNLKIEHDIASAAVANEVLPNSVVMVEALLRPKTRLVRDTDGDGELLDTYTAKVKFDDVDKDDKPIVLDLSIKEAVERMKELPEKYGNLFKGNNVGGLGGNTGTQGKMPDMAKISTDEYMERRKKDPASVGLS